MGLWREHLHWSVLLRWDVLAYTTGVLLGIGGLVLVFDQYAAANVCFILTALLVLAKVFYLAITAADPWWHRLLFAFLLGGIVVVGIVGTVRGVNAYATKKHAREKSSASEASATPHSTPATRTKTNAPTTSMVSVDNGPGSRLHPLTLDPSIFTGFYKHHTTLKAAALYNPYFGKWIIIRGRVMDVWPRDNDGSTGVKLSAGHYKTTVGLRFSKREQSDAVALLDRGDKLAATCRLSYVFNSGLTADQCEIVND
jgi:hypothetical protein